MNLAVEINISGDELAEIYDARGLAYNYMSFYEESVSDLTKAVELYTSKNKRIDIWRFLSWIYSIDMDDIDTGIHYARKLVEEIAPMDKSSLIASAYLNAAVIFIYSINPEEGISLLQKGIAIAEEMGYRDILGRQYSALRWVYTASSSD
ncbi:hypothetical protein GF312_04265 [Candidatus Poribacteria bacterium]|nr:hypothetical protein [Candidatus Poribacteria bacterium]